MSIVLEPLVHRGQHCIAFKGGLNAAANRVIREFPAGVQPKRTLAGIFPSRNPVWQALQKVSHLFRKSRSEVLIPFIQKIKK